MVRSFVEVLLGDIGRQILYFYEAHALIIDIVVLAYGFILFFSWSNLVKIHRYLVIEIAKQIVLKNDLDKDSSPKKVIKKVHIPWADAVKKSRFPLVAKMSGLLPRKKSVALLKTYLIEEDLAANALSVVNGRDIRKVMPNTKHMTRQDIESIKKKNSSK
jgi:hypothetical protein